VLAIKTRKLSKSYYGAAEVLSDLDLEVHAGEAFGLLGPNGAGKTTTIHCLLDLVRPTRGHATIFGRSVGDPVVRARVGYLPESVTLHEYYRGEELLGFYAALLGIEGADRARRIAAVLDLLDLRAAARQRISEYSKGMLQRLGFAQALLHDPDLLILDEPTASLDPVARKQFAEILGERKRQGTTILISSHILSEVEQICDRAAILKAGTLVRAGTLEELSRTSAVKLHVKSVPPALVERLLAAGAEVARAGGDTTVRCGDRRLRGEVEGILAGEGVAIERVEAEHSSLEAAFFAAVEGVSPS
jgi:ABC-2 type transport system ATP-binding protein